MSRRSTEPEIGRRSIGAWRRSSASGRKSAAFFGLNDGDDFIRQLRYERHRRSLMEVRSRINNRPKPVLISSAMQLFKLREDDSAYSRINTQNRELLQRIDQIIRCTGKTDSYLRARDIRIPQWRYKQSISNTNFIEKTNFAFGCSLLKAKSMLNTRQSVEEYNTEMQERQFKIKPTILRQYSKIVLPAEAAMITELLRPKIFFDLAVRDKRPLGRVSIQLFTEACPDVVLQFVRMCTYQALDLFEFIRIFPMLWIEGELRFESGILFGPKFEHNMHILDHGYGAGIFSFAKSYLKGFKHGLINFSISFKPLSVLNGERLAFGVVTRGLRIVDILQDFGTKNGKTKNDIVVVKCGVLN